MFINNLVHTLVSYSQLRFSETSTFFVFFGCTCHTRDWTPGPGIEPTPKQQPKPQWWGWILNSLCHKGTPRPPVSFCLDPNMREVPFLFWRYLILLVLSAVLPTLQRRKSRNPKKKMRLTHVDVTKCSFKFCRGIYYRHIIEGCLKFCQPFHGTLIFKVESRIKRH